MNLLAFVFLVGSITSLVFVIVFSEQVEDVLRAVAERIRNPRPSALEELHRHWEVQDGKRKVS